MEKEAKKKLKRSYFGMAKRVGGFKREEFKREEIDRFETEYKDKKSNQTSP